jgi:hypothetical protein
MSIVHVSLPRQLTAPKVGIRGTTSNQKDRSTAANAGVISGETTRTSMESTDISFQEQA